MSSVSNVANACVAVAHLQSSSINKLSLSPSALKASSTDGYNWRKYGQKQVKSPQGFRSYFRCTYSECCAKKIEFSDHLGHLRETIYKSQHNHDPPRKVNSVKQSRIMKTAGPLKESNAAEYPIPVLNDSNPSATSRESVRDMSMVPKGIPQDSTGFYEDAKTTSKGGDALESEPKDRRVLSNFYLLLIVLWKLSTEALGVNIFLLLPILMQREEKGFIPLKPGTTTREETKACYTCYK